VNLNVPLLRRHPKPDDDGYYIVGPALDLTQEHSTTLVLAGDTVIIVRLSDGLYAFSADCPHAAGDLRKGHLYRGRIDCPVHAYRFDVRSGRVLWPPDEVCRLKRYEAIERDGQIKIRPMAPGPS